MTSSDRLERRERRLKSLDEFTPLPWHRKRTRTMGWLALLAIGLVLGGSAGWLLAG